MGTYLLHVGAVNQTLSPAMGDSLDLVVPSDWDTMVRCRGVIAARAVRALPRMVPGAPGGASPPHFPASPSARTAWGM
jgi:hypothetical protein